MGRLRGAEQTRYKMVHKSLELFFPFTGQAGPNLWGLLAKALGLGRSASECTPAQKKKKKKSLASCTKLAESVLGKEVAGWHPLPPARSPAELIFD